ncbi:MAG: phosphoribosylanthranilate isomerase [Myxococcota bacterium]|jgi:phosphoribosylanthranilate isomerase
MRVKVCGVITEESIAALTGQADFVGFNFWPRSSRYVTPVRAAELAEGLENRIQRVGLFVDADPAAVTQALEAMQLDLLQFHGAETPDYCRSFGVPFMKAFRLRDERTLSAIGDYIDGPNSAFLVDAFVTGVVGGSGHPVRLDLAARARESTDARMFLAGGLTASTVAGAVSLVSPFAVDVASGVETAPGHKDPALVADFARAARGTT